MSRRSELLEFAVLGLLHERPMHGYELRRRLNSALGAFRALSYGTLYPCLRALTDAGHLEPIDQAGDSARARIAYALTASGRTRFAELAQRADASAYADDAFDVRVAFFGRTEGTVRLRILEGRRRTLTERLERTRDDSGTEGWLATLARHDVEQLQRDIAWLGDLIERETRTAGVERSPLTDPNHPAFRAATPRLRNRTTSR